MPIYDYSCNACGHRQSRFFRTFGTTPAVVRCEACGSEDTQRLYSSTFAVTMAPNRVERELANSPASAYEPENQKEAGDPWLTVPTPGELRTPT